MTLFAIHSLHYMVIIGIKWLDLIFAAVGKRLSSASKKAGGEDLKLWEKGIKNHLYYSVLSSDGKIFSQLIIYMSNKQKMCSFVTYSIGIKTITQRNSLMVVNA